MRDFLYEYLGDLDKALTSLDSTIMRGAADLIVNATTIYVAGNGGSAAIANHLCCDITKGCNPHQYIQTVSLVANTSMLTAIGNDLGYENTLSFQLETALVSLQDLVLLISSSGNSPNIVKAAQVAKKHGVRVLAFTGFTGGKLAELADVNIHVKSDNYGIVEDCHQAAMHCIAQYIVSRSSKSQAV